MEAGDGFGLLAKSRDAELQKMYGTIGLASSSARVADSWSGLIPRTFDMLFEVESALASNCALPAPSGGYVFLCV
jgi:hypothetical protein